MTDLTAEATSRFVQVDDTRVHYHEAGEGPVVILLHGGGPGGSGWSNFKQNLPTLSRRFRVLIIDQLGYGQTDKPELKEPFYVASAKLIKGVMDTLGIEQADFVGNSLGGGTSLRLALDFPTYVRRLILMGPGGGAKSIISADPSEGMKLLGGFYDEPGPSKERMWDILRVMTYDHTFLNDALLEERFAAAMAPGAREGALAALGSITSRAPEELPNQLWRELDQVAHETLLVWGRDDRTLPLDGAFLALKQIPNAHLHVFSRCGHWAQLEHRDAFDRLTIDFLLGDE